MVSAGAKSSKLHFKQRCLLNLLNSILALLMIYSPTKLKSVKVLHSEVSVAKLLSLWYLLELKAAGFISSSVAEEAIGRLDTKLWLSATIMHTCICITCDRDLTMHGSNYHVPKDFILAVLYLFIQSQAEPE